VRLRSLPLGGFLVITSIAPAALVLSLAASPSLVWTQQSPEARSASVVRQSPAGRIEVLASLPVLPGYEPRASLAPDASAIIACALDEARDRERGATLWRIALPGGKASALERGVALTPPIALSRARAAFLKVVARVPASPERRQAGEYDAVVTEIRLLLEGGNSVPLMADESYGLFLAGAIGDSLVVYRVSKDEAAFYLLPATPGASWRRLAAAPHGPFARDFSVRRGRLYFASLIPGQVGAGVFSLDLSTGETREVVRVQSDHPTPLAFGGDLVFARPVASGEELAAWDGSAVRGLARTGGVAFPLAGDASGRYLAFGRTGASQELWLLDREKPTPVRLSTETYFTVFGFGELP
jgi:hypothetical protein